MNTTESSPVVVLGATGKTGRRIVSRLEARGVPVRAGSRSASPAFDWSDEATWRPVLRGARAVYVAYFPDLGIPGAADVVGRLATLAAEEGVSRLVLLSGRGQEGSQRAEQLVQAAALDATVVRCAWFMQNFSEEFLAEGVAAGELMLPIDEVPEPFVDCEDIADVAVAALVEDGHAGEIYELTGPRPLRFDEAMAEISRATGREVRFTPVPLDAYVAALREMGTPDEVVDALIHLFGEVFDGRNAGTADGVQRALGREPRSFADYARDTAAAGAFGAVRTSTPA